MASTAENWAKSDNRVLAEPPRVFSTECARVTLDGVGWKGSESVWVRKSVPDATIRNGRLIGDIVCISWPWRRRAIELRKLCQDDSSCQGAGTVIWEALERLQADEEGGNVTPSKHHLSLVCRHNFSSLPPSTYKTIEMSTLTSPFRQSYRYLVSSSTYVLFADQFTMPLTATASTRTTRHFLFGGLRFHRACHGVDCATDSKKVWMETCRTYPNYISRCVLSVYQPKPRYWTIGSVPKQARRPVEGYEDDAWGCSRYRCCSYLSYWRSRTRSIWALHLVTVRMSTTLRFALQSNPVHWTAHHQWNEYPQCNRCPRLGQNSCMSGVGLQSTPVYSSFTHRRPTRMRWIFHFSFFISYLWKASFLNTSDFVSVDQMISWLCRTCDYGRTIIFSAITAAYRFNTGSLLSRDLETNSYCHDDSLSSNQLWSNIHFYWT